MIIQKDMLNKLRVFGLNSYESKIWAALLSRGISTAGELSDIANVPRSRSYDVLESLEKKGFVIMKLGKPIKYIAVKPEEVIERLKKRIRKDAEEREKSIEGLKNSELVGELNALHGKGVELTDLSDMSGSIKGGENLRNHISSMINSAEESVVIMTSKEGLKKEAESLKRVLKKAKERGVTIRIAAPIGETNMVALGILNKIAEVRDIKEIKARFCVVDNKEIAFMLMEDEKVNEAYDAGVWANAGVFAQSLVYMFDKVWNETKQVKKSEGSPPT